MTVREPEPRDQDLYYRIDRTYNDGIPDELGGHSGDYCGFGVPIEASGNGPEDNENASTEPKGARWMASMLSGASHGNRPEGSDGAAASSQGGSYVQCADGHFYNPQVHVTCPFCSDPDGFAQRIPAGAAAEPSVPAQPPVQPAPVPPIPVPPRRPRIAPLVIGGVVTIAVGLGWIARAELLGLATRLGAPFRNRPVAAQPAIDLFSADPQVIDPGSATQLVVAVRNAERVTIEPGVGAIKSQDRVLVRPETTTTYTLNASGPGGVERRTLVVTVKAALPKAPSIKAFYADAKEIRAGEAANLTWRVSDATEVRIEPAPGVVVGDRVQVRPMKTTVYTLVAKGPGGSQMQTLTITLQPAAKANPEPREEAPPPAPQPRIVSFTSDHAAIEAGGEAVLSYSVADAASVSIDPGVGTFTPLNEINQVKVRPLKTTTYSLRARGPGGEDVATIRVTVNEPSAPPAPPPPSPQPLSGVFHCPNGPVRQGQTVYIDNLPARPVDLSIDQTTWWAMPFQPLPNGERRLPLVARKPVNGCEITWKTKN